MNPILLLGLAAGGYYIYSERKKRQAKANAAPTPESVANHAMAMLGKVIIDQINALDCNDPNIISLIDPTMTPASCEAAKAEGRATWALEAPQITAALVADFKALAKAEFDAGAPCIMAATTPTALGLCPMFTDALVRVQDKFGATVPTEQPSPWDKLLAQVFASQQPTFVEMFRGGYRWKR